MIKTLKGNVEEMAKNPIASLFLIQVVNQLDDTVTGKKYIVNDLVTKLEELMEDRIGRRTYVGLLNSISPQAFSKDEIQSMIYLQDESTSKKSAE